MNKCAVTLAWGFCWSSYESPSVRLLTAALEALYAALPLGTRQIRHIRWQKHVRWVGNALFGAGINDHGRVLLVDHTLHQDQLLHIQNAKDTLTGAKTCCTLSTLELLSFDHVESDETNPKTLTLKTLCQLSKPSHEVPLSPTPALFINTPTSPQAS